MIYLPKHFAETDLAALHDLIDGYSFGTLIIKNASGDLDLAHLPFFLDRKDGEKGTLLTHVARANRIWRSVDGKSRAMVIFQGPHAYISPGWYKSDIKVPTWNYAVVHAHGVPKKVSEAELYSILKRLTDKHEALLENPWRIEDLPPDQWERFKKEILGIKIEIDELVGKFKLSQNREADDREAAIEGLVKRDALFDAELASLMERKHRESSTL